jgi:hypothetical protein
MIGEIQFDFSSLQGIIILFIIVLASIYFYYELKKIKYNIIDIENELTKLYQNPVTDNQYEIGKQVVNDIKDINDINDIKDIKDINDILDINDELNEWSEINQLMQDETIINNDNKDQDLENPQDQDLENPQDKDLENQQDQDLENQQDQDLENQQDQGTAESAFSIDNILDSLNISNSDETNLDINDNEETCKTNEKKETKEKDEVKNITPNYESMTVTQLKGILSELNLPLSGNKTKLIKRIQENKSLEV